MSETITLPETSAPPPPAGWKDFDETQIVEIIHELKDILPIAWEFERADDGRPVWVGWFGEGRSVTKHDHVYVQESHDDEDGWAWGAFLRTVTTGKYCTHYGTVLTDTYYGCASPQQALRHMVSNAAKIVRVMGQLPLEDYDAF